jgi:ubiquinone biosynthesis protein COQ9
MTGLAIPPEDMTLDELRVALVPLLPAEAAFDGWSPVALGRAAGALGIPADRAALVFPRGAVDMIDAWFATIDDAMRQALPPATLGAMKMRERIRALVWARIKVAAPDREALRRALAVLAQPQHALRAVRLAWRAADAVWRLAGDTATDLNHYSKRAILVAVYGSTLLAWLDDESEGFADTAAFLDRRIDEVMRFEKAKARLMPAPGDRFSLVRLLGRLRYPAH